MIYSFCTGSSPIDKLMLVAECLYESKQYDVCIHVQQTILDMKQASEEIRLKSQYLLAMCYQKHEELDRALDQFHTLLSQALSHKNNVYEAAAYENLAQLNLRLGQIQQGIVFYEKLLSICEDLKKVTNTDETKTQACDMDHLVGDRLQKHVHEILTSAYRAASDLSQALLHADQYLHRTLQNEPEKNQEVVGKAYLLVGFFREGLGDYATALKHYQEYFAVSKKENDRAGMARAYGCLGRVYHQLCNYTLALSYYGQQLAIAEKLKYMPMVASALKNLAKIYADEKKNDKALECLERYLRVSRKLDEFFTECEALMDIGDFYLGAGRPLQSEYYFEQACNVAERTKLSEHQHRAAAKLAEVLVQSEEEKNVEKARYLCEESIKFCQRLETVYEEEGNVFPEVMRQCCSQSYAILKVSLCKLKRNLEALEHAEAQNSRGFQKTLTKQARDGVIDRNIALKFEDICKLVNSQSSTVVYYDVTNYGVLTWVLKPSEGCVHFTKEHVDSTSGDCVERLQELVSSVHSSAESLQSMYDCEYRALPTLDSETHKVQLYFKRLSRTYSASSRVPTRSSTRPPSAATEATPNPLRILHKILWEPVSGYVPEGEVIVVTDGILTQFPFDSLTNEDDHQLGETHRVTSIPSLKLLQHLILNQPNINDLYLADSADDLASQASGKIISVIIRLMLVFIELANIWQTGSPFIDKLL